MDKMNGKDTTQLIEATKERLRWYTLEASEEEYDAEEVEALVNLLNALEPMEVEENQSDEAILESFHEYVKMRDAEEGIASYRSSATKKKYSGLTTFVKTHKFIAAAAVVLIVVFVAGGSLGAVNASKGNGFFYWLNRDEKGMTMITSPENMDREKGMNKEVEYQKDEDVPNEYKEYLVNTNLFNELNGYEQEYIALQYTESYYGIKRCLKNSLEEREICIGAFVFSDEVRLTYETFLGEEGKSDSWKEQEEGILSRKSYDGNVEYKIFFYKDNIQYYVEGNVDKEMLIEIATKYEEIVYK